MPAFNTSMTTRFSQYREAFLRLIYPVVCPLCGTLPGFESRSLCGNCHVRLESHAIAPDDAHQTFRKGPLAETFSIFHHRAEVQTLLTRVKFASEIAFLEAFREYGANFLLAHGLKTRYDYLVPVPLSLSRLLMRRFNQAEVLAQMFSSETGLSVRADLKKIWQTPSQSRLTREERGLNLQGCFKTKKPPLPGASILLVDDIFTTGATAREAAKVL